MKKVPFICFALGFLLLLSASGYGKNEDSGALIDADRICYEKTPLNKLGRGVINVSTCWVEIPADIAKISTEKNEVAGWTLGLVEGICTALMRGLTGIIDVVGFAIPPYGKPLMEPEYALQSLTDKWAEYNYNK